jgi:hypothetical protein
MMASWEGLEMSLAETIMEGLSISLLAAENSGRVVEFVRRRFTKQGEVSRVTRAKKSYLRAAWIFLRHRTSVYEELYEASFESGGDVLYVSIMSESTLRDSMKENLQRAVLSRTKLRVLTWDPAVGADSVEAFRKHLNEKTNAQRQVEMALKNWTDLAHDFPKAIRQLRKYQSAPTMQGIVVKDRWALLELLPYGVRTRERPALLLDARTNVDLYEVLCSPLERLFEEAETVVDNQRKATGRSVKH